MRLWKLAVGATLFSVPACTTRSGSIPLIDADDGSRAGRMLLQERRNLAALNESIGDELIRYSVPQHERRRLRAAILPRLHSDANLHILRQSADLRAAYVAFGETRDHYLGFVTLSTRPKEQGLRLSDPSMIYVFDRKTRRLKFVQRERD